MLTLRGTCPSLSRIAPFWLSLSLCLLGHPGHFLPLRLSPVWMSLTGTYTHIHIHSHTRRCGTRNRASQARKARRPRVLRRSRDCAVASTVIGDMVSQSSSVPARPPVHRFRATSWGVFLGRRSCWRITRGGCVGTRMQCDVALESVWRGCSYDAHQCAR